MKIFTEKYEIISNGSVIIPSGEYLEFEIESLRFRFIFKDKERSESGQLTPNISGAIVNEEDSEYLSIIVSNFDSLFAAPQNVLEVGTIKGKKLSVIFSIVILGLDNEYSRIFHYTWFIEK